MRGLHPSSIRVLEPQACSGAKQMDIPRTKLQCVLQFHQACQTIARRIKTEFVNEHLPEQSDVHRRHQTTALCIEADAVCFRDTDFRSKGLGDDSTMCIQAFRQGDLHKLACVPSPSTWEALTLSHLIRSWHGFLQRLMI